MLCVFRSPAELEEFCGRFCRERFALRANPTGKKVV
jgi:hypothetical protein